MGNVDLRPDHAAEGGGLVDDFDGVITDMRFIMSDYNGSISNPVPTFVVTFNIDGEESVAWYSVGGKDDFVPDETGRGLTQLKGKTTLTKTCNYIMFMDSLVKSGFPLNKMDPRDVSPMIGIEGHFLRKPVKHDGLKKTGDRDSTILLCTAVTKLPGEGGTGKKTRGGRKTKGAVVDEGLADQVAGFIVAILAEADGEAAKTKMLSAFFKNPEVKALPNKKDATTLAANDTFLAGREEWEYANGVLTL